MERFLRYSLERGRKIRVMVETPEGIRQWNALVTALTPETVTLTLAKGEKVVPRLAVLAAAYARGDEGASDF